VDPVKTMRALARSAQAIGVALWTNEEVTAIDVADGTVHGVRTARRNVPADIVLIAAGAWSGRLARQAGVDLPVSPRRIQIVASAPTERVTDMLWGGNGLYSRQGSTGALHFGAEGPPWDPSVETFERRTTEPTLRRIARRMVELTPALRGLRLARAWSGIIGPSVDGQPIIDLTQAPSGLAFATGFGGNGFGTGPASGEAIAELILTGATSVETGAMRLARFGADVILSAHALRYSGSAPP
jgi:sarcosine oxidase subunit beta